MPSAWVEVGNIIGPPGPAGDPGATGPPGPIPSDSILVRNFFFNGKTAAGIAVGKVAGYWTSKVAGQITAWDITVDAGTIRLKIWKIAAGLAKPTAANSINSVGIALTTGTSTGLVTDVSDFLTVAVAIGDIFAAEVVAVGGGVTDFGGSISITADTDAAAGAAGHVFGLVPTPHATIAGRYITADNFIDGTLSVYLNGLRMKLTTDFTVTGTNSFQMTDTPTPGDVLTVDYLKL